MDNVVIKKELGSGVFGTTYKVKINNKYYALKRQKILKKHMKEDDTSPIWRELYFYEWVSTLNANDQRFFIRLHDFKFYKCDFKMTPYIKPQGQLKILIDKLNKSPYCLDLIIDLKKDNITKLVYENKLNDKQRYSLIVQCLYMIHVLRKNKWVHTDMHLRNITYDITEIAKIPITINKHKHMIPTYGKIYTVIDYGLVFNKNFNMILQDKKWYDHVFKYNGDLIMLIDCLLLNNQFLFSDNRKNKIRIPHRYMNYIQKNYPKIWAATKNYMLNTFFIDDNDTKYCVSWFRQYETNKFTKRIQHDQRSRLIEWWTWNIFSVYDRKSYCKIYNHEYYDMFIRLEHIEYVLHHIHNLEDLILYFISLI
jgi:hypothetical protein